jgi:serine/threonine protein kinase
MTARERYQLIGPLATGGMAEVLLARSVGPQGIERLLAVKRILPERARDPEFVRMFLDEARNAAVLAHHHIVQVFDIEMRDGVVFYAMEYLHGQTLAAVASRAQRLPLATAIAIGIAVAAGLHHAHERRSPIIHRDVAPSNVMITYDGNIKLIDFGIAKSATNLSNTVFGTFKGRLGYASPEQCRCELVDRRTDVYSLAILLYELATGRSAITAATEQEMIERMTAAQIAPPSTFDPAFPRDLEAVLMKALSRDRADRYASAEELQHELEVFAQRHGLHASALALSRMMNELFAGELEPWHRARDSGRSLEDHILSITMHTLPPTDPALDELPTHRRASRARLRAVVVRRAQWWIRIAIVLALFGAAYFAARWWLEPLTITAARPSP